MNTFHPGITITKSEMKQHTNKNVDIVKLLHNSKTERLGKN